MPLRLLRYASQRFSGVVNTVIEDSIVLKVVRVFLENLFNMSSRVYGLFIIAFSAVQGLLGFSDMSKIVQLALFMGGAALIIINRPVKSLAEGSIICRAAFGFFGIWGNTLSNNGEEKLIPQKCFEITAVITGILLGVLWHFLQPMTFIIAVGGIAAFVLVLWRYEIGVYAVVGFIPLAPTTALLGLILLTAISFYQASQG